MQESLPSPSQKVCTDGRKTKGAFFGEISDHMDSSLPKNGRSRKRSFTMTRACPRAPRDDENRGEKNDKLILAAKTRRKSNISSKGGQAEKGPHIHFVFALR